jgi:hypothetical protein
MNFYCFIVICEESSPVLKMTKYSYFRKFFMKDEYLPSFPSPLFYQYLLASKEKLQPAVTVHVNISLTFGPRLHVRE